METPELRVILAHNLKRIIEHDASPGERPSIRAWAIARELDVRLIDRLTKGQHAVTLDKLQQVADACGLQPWQLLLEEFDVSAPPDAPISEEERTLLKRLRRLLGS